MVETPNAVHFGENNHFYPFSERTMRSQGKTAWSIIYHFTSRRHCHSSNKEQHTHTHTIRANTTECSIDTRTTERI